jgi:DNA-binding winged helix-turn-helix (wHTH) protein/tetratricopeptide (TPR) repeat protein
MSPGAKELYEFGPFRIDPDKETLLRGGEPVPLTPKTFQILLVLVRHSKEVVTKDELMKMVWPDTFVEEANLSRNIFMLRKALGDTAQDRYIVTVPGRGYRLAENVHLVPGEDLTIVASSHSRVQVDVKETKPWTWVAVAAVVLLAAAAGAWLVLRHRAAPRGIAALNEKDTVVLADFANTTGDPVFDETLRRGLAIQLEQSPFLSLISDERVHQILSLMGRSSDRNLTPAIAYEVCERAGSTAVLEGSIRPIGNQYVLGLSAKNCRNGEILDEEQVQAARKEDVLNALGKMAGNFRTRVGESFTTIEQHNTPLAEATTPSLEALKAYSMGWKVISSTGSAASVPLYQRAVEIDPHFAMAYAMLGRVYGDVGESALSAENTTKAWQLRERTTGWERFFIEASYDVQVTGNLEKAQQTCEAWAKTYPRDTRPYGFLSGMIYPVQGRYDQAVEKSRKMIDYDPDFVVGYNILALAEMTVGNLEQAERTLQKADDRKLKMPDLFIDRYQLAFVKNDQDGMARVASETPRESGTEDWIAHMQSTALAYSGHLQQATKMSQRAIDLAKHSDQPERAALFQSEEAIRDAFFENKATAVRHAESALKLSHGRDVQYGAAFALALTGNVPRVRLLADDLEKRFPEDTAVKFIYIPELRALIALNQRDPQRAIELLQPTAAYEQGLPPSSFFGFYGMYYPAYLRGEAYLAQHQGPAAAAEFQKILDHRGVVISDPIGALAHLQQGRALALSGDKVKAKGAYREFLRLWKDADPGIPVVERARVEYVNLD